MADEYDPNKLESLLDDRSKARNTLTDILQGRWSDMARSKKWGERDTPYKLTDEERTQLIDGWMDDLKDYLKSTGVSESQMEDRMDHYFVAFFGIDSATLRDFATKTPVLDRDTITQQTDRWASTDLNRTLQGYVGRTITDENYSDVVGDYADKIKGEKPDIKDASEARNFVTQYVFNEYRQKNQWLRDYSAQR